MTPPALDDATLVLRGRVEAVAGLWLVVLPLLRPLIWSGQPSDVPNLFYLVLVAAAITTGLLLRGLSVPDGMSTRKRWWQRPAILGSGFLTFAVWGCATSPLPAAAWTLTAGWCLHLAVPLALWPAIRSRPHLLVAGLLAGLAGEVVLLVGQVVWERPLLAAQLAADPALTVERRVAEQYEARISSWRLEGTFLLANTLASYLLMLVPLALGCAWACWQTRVAGRWLALFVASLSLVAVVMSGSKAGLLALVMAGLAGALVWLRSWRWRGVLLLVVALALVSALSVPSLRRAVADSAGVRLDYWTAGVTLVQERPLTGHGLEGFAVHYPRVKPPAGEETILAHQETLQAAVDLGLPAMVILLIWWASVVWSLRPSAVPAIPAQRDDATSGPGWVVMIGVPLLMSFACVAAGALQANFSAYPGASPLLWSVVFVAGVTLVVNVASRLPLPPPAAIWCAVVAVLLHVQADFSLHSMQVVGVLAWVVALGRALAHPCSDSEPGPASPRRQAVFAGGGLAVLALVAFGVITASTRGEVLERAREAEAVFARLRLIEQGRIGEPQRSQTLEAFEHAYARVVVEDRAAALTADPRESLALATIRRAVEASRRFPADHDLVFAAVAIGEHFQALLPSRAEALTPILEDLLVEWPQDLLVTRALSEHYLRLARRATGARQHQLARHAQAMAQRAVALYPTHLPLRQTVITAAELTGDKETVAAQQAEIQRLKPLVHRDNQPAE